MSRPGLLALLFLGLAFSSYTYAKTLKNQWDMVFVSIPAGEFLMGLDDYEGALMEVPEPGPGELKDELPQHRVKISHGFYLGQTEVTQQQWLSIMENRPGPRAQWQRPDWQHLPVVSVNWFMAQRFIQEINLLDKRYQYRLPTEAEWEYAARAGNGELRPVAEDSLGDYAWFIHNSGDQPHKVASLKANAFGVYDMLGNVWEWVADWYAADSYAAGGPVRIDPAGPVDGFSRVRRGGSFHCPLHLTRPGYRGANRPGVAYEVTGFRLVLQPQ